MGVIKQKIEMLNDLKSSVYEIYNSDNRYLNFISFNNNVNDVDHMYRLPFTQLNIELIALESKTKNIIKEIYNKRIRKMFLKYI